MKFYIKHGSLFACLQLIASINVHAGDQPSASTLPLLIIPSPRQSFLPRQNFSPVAPSPRQSPSPRSTQSSSDYSQINENESFFLRANSPSSSHHSISGRSTPLVPVLSEEQMQALKKKFSEKIAEHNKNNAHKKIQVQQDQQANKALFAASALAVSFATITTPQIVARVIERNEGSRFFGASLIAANSLTSVLPTLLSMAGGAFALHKIHGWLYGDMANQIEKLNTDVHELQVARIQEQERTIVQITQALQCSQQAHRLLQEIEPEVRNLQESHQVIVQNIREMKPLMQSVQDQVQALHEAASIENISLPDISSCTDSSSHGSLWSSNIPGQRGFAHAVSKRISEIGARLYPNSKQR